jgi:hypothetical protein
LEALERGRAVCGQLVRENPTVNEFRNRLVYACIWDAKGLNVVGRPDDALRVVAQSREIIDADLHKDANRNDRRGDLGSIMMQTGDARTRKGERGPALEALHQAIALMELALREVDEPWQEYELACAYSLKAGLVSGASSVPSRPGEPSRAADLAVDRLNKLIAAGFRMRHWFANDRQLDALRGRDDFRLLMMDLAMPAEPFARAR